MTKKIRHMSNKLDIISLYLNDYPRTFSGRAVAEKTALSPQTALNNLNELVKRQILSFTVHGRNKEYKLELKNIQSRIMLEMAEHFKALKRLQYEELNILINEMIRECESIVLFGSFADWKETKDSDIDLVIIGKTDKEKIKQIKDKYPRKINIEFISLKDLEISLKERKALAIEIAKKHILFGNIKPIIDIFSEYPLK